MFFASLLFACIRSTPGRVAPTQTQLDPVPRTTPVCDVLFEEVLAQAKGVRVSTMEIPFQSYGPEIPSGTFMGEWQAQQGLPSVPVELGFLACSPPPSLPKQTLEDWREQVCERIEPVLFIRFVEVWMNSDQAYAEVHMFNGPYLAAGYLDAQSCATTLRLGLERVDGVWKVAEVQRDDHPSLPQCR